MSSSWRNYLAGHRVGAGLAVAWGCTFVSALFGDVPLPIPVFTSVGVPALTLDAILALAITAAIVASITTPIGYFEEAGSKRWRLADLGIVLALCLPAFVISVLSAPASMLARDVVIYLLMTILVGAVASVEAGLVLCAVWIIAQSALWGTVSHTRASFLVLILNSSPRFVAWLLLPIVFLAWFFAARAIKLRTGTVSG